MDELVVRLAGITCLLKLREDFASLNRLLAGDFAEFQRRVLGGDQADENPRHPVTAELSLGGNGSA